MKYLMSRDEMKSSHLRNLGIIVAAMAVFVLPLAACGDDDDGPSAEELREVEETLTQTLGSSGDNADYVFAHVTDNLIETLFFATREECVANAMECIGEPAVFDAVSGTEIDGDTATALADTGFGRFEIGLVREDDSWKVDSVAAASDDVPDGAAVVDLELRDFDFAFSQEDIPADGNFAFHVSNTGEQTHEVVVVAIPDGQELEEALGAVAEETVPPAAFKVYIRPGQEADMAFDEPLQPGQYALVCFFPDTSDPEFAPHFEKGMVSTFRVQ